MPVHEIEPDPRFTLANERTYLAWLRTALTMLAGALAVGALDVGHDANVRRVVAGILVVLAALCAVHARVSWARTERALRAAAPLPRGRAPVSLVVGIVLLSAAVFALQVVG